MALYDRLLALTPTTPIVALNRAIALAEIRGADAALLLVDELHLELADYHPFHATRAELLRRLGRPLEAAAAYETAISLTSTRGSDNSSPSESLSSRSLYLL